MATTWRALGAFTLIVGTACACGASTPPVETSPPPSASPAASVAVAAPVEPDAGAAGGVVVAPGVEVFNGKSGEVLTDQGVDVLRERLASTSYTLTRMDVDVNPAFWKARYVKITTDRFVAYVAQIGGYLEYPSGPRAHHFDAIAFRSFLLDDFFATDRAARVHFTSAVLTYASPADHGVQIFLDGRTVLRTSGQGGAIAGSLPVNSYLQPHVVGPAPVGAHTVKILGGDATNVKVQIIDTTDGDRLLVGTDAAPGHDVRRSFTIASDVRFAGQEDVKPQGSGLAPRFFAMTFRGEPGVHGDLRLNGVVMETLDGRGAGGSSNQPQYWLRTGKNEVELTVTSLDEAAARAEPGKPLVESKVVGLPWMGFPSEGDALTELSWPATKDAKAHPKTGHLRVTFEVPFAPPSQLWSAASPLAALSARDRKDITARLLEFRQVEEGKDFKRLGELRRFEEEDRARAMGEVFDPTRVETELKMLAAFGQGRAHVDNPAPRLRVVSSKVVEVSFGPPPLVPLYLAKIDGEWTFVR